MSNKYSKNISVCQNYKNNKLSGKATKQASIPCVIFCKTIELVFIFKVFKKVKDCNNMLIPPKPINPDAITAEICNGQPDA